MMRFESFSKMLEYYAEEQPQAPALKYGEKALSFAALASEVRAAADRYRAENKSCLAVLADGSLDCVISIFAANAAGLTIVMLDPSLPEDLLAKLTVHTEADALWTADEELAEILAPAIETAAKTAGATDRSGSPQSPDRLLFFTSGTTSSSKAVVLTGKSLCSSAWNGSQMLPLVPDDTLLCMLPLAHVFGFICGLLWGLSCGACVALGQGPRAYISDFKLYRPTAVSVVPALLAFMLKAGAINPELKTLLIGAGDCPQHLIDAAKAKGLHVSFGYGLTETSSGVAISTGGDPYAMDICPDDTVTIAEDGEVLLYAPTCMMQGYYKDPEGTAKVLRGGVLYTGDLGRIDENGRLHITGRKKDMLVLADGTKIFLPEYEAALAKILKSAELAVDLKGERPVLICPKEEAREDLLEKLRPAMEKLPRGQQLTGIITVNGPLPRTATGKIKRWELRQKAGLQ